MFHNQLYNKQGEKALQLTWGQLDFVFNFRRTIFPIADSFLLLPPFSNMRRSDHFFFQLTLFSFLKELSEIIWTITTD